MIYLLGGVVVTRGAPVWLCSKPWAVPEFQDNCCSTRTSYFFGRNAWGTAASTCLVAKKSSTLAYQPDISPAEFGIYACLLSSFPGYRAVHARPRVTVTSSKHIRLVSFTLDLVAVSLLCKIIILFCLILHSKHRKAIVHIFIRKRCIWQCPRLPIIHIYLNAMYKNLLKLNAYSYSICLF